MGGTKAGESGVFRGGLDGGAFAGGLDDGGDLLGGSGDGFPGDRGAGGVLGFCTGGGGDNAGGLVDE